MYQLHSLPAMDSCSTFALIKPLHESLSGRFQKYITVLISSSIKIRVPLICYLEIISPAAVLLQVAVSGKEGNYTLLRTFPSQ